LLEHNLVFGNPAIHSEVHGDNFAADYDRARAAFVRLSMEPSMLDLRLRANVEAPRSAIGEDWLSFPGAEQDFTRHQRLRAQFGACPSETDSTYACR